MGMQTALVLTTVLSVVVAATMSAVVWRLRRDERRRSDARVALLAAEFRDLEIGGTPRAGDLFHAGRSAPAASRFAVVLAVGAFVVGTAVTLTLVASRAERPVAAQASAPVRADAPSVPLELVALDHERDGDRITIRGVVRNPAAGAPLSHVTAVVFLSNRDGGFVTSSRASVEAAVLAPGSQSTFVVTALGASDIGRYRVSFRVDDRVVPHVDRRDRGPVDQLRENP